MCAMGVSRDRLEAIFRQAGHELSTKRPSASQRAQQPSGQLEAISFLDDLGHSAPLVGVLNFQVLIGANVGVSAQILVVHLYVEGCCSESCRGACWWRSFPCHSCRK